MTQATTAHLSNFHTQRCNKWSHYQRGFIANAAGRVLINLDTRNCREIHHIAGLSHRHSQVSRLVRGHALIKDGHSKRRSLVIGNITSYITRDKVINFCVGKLASVALLFNHIVHAHS